MMLFFECSFSIIILIFFCFSTMGSGLSALKTGSQTDGRTRKSLELLLELELGAMMFYEKESAWNIFASLDTSPDGNNGVVQPNGCASISVLVSLEIFRFFIFYFK